MTTFKNKLFLNILLILVKNLVMIVMLDMIIKKSNNNKLKVSYYFLFIKKNYILNFRTNKNNIYIYRYLKFITITFIKK